MEKNDNYDCDVVVIGGGPAGSTVATQLAQKNWQVVLLEKKRFPRFHIGESLLPLNLPILQRLGVLEKVQEIGIRKNGAEFNDEKHGAPVIYSFSASIDKTLPYAYQVKRSEFDQILLNNSKDNGVLVSEGVQVTNVEFSSYQDIRVSARDDNGDDQTLRTRFIVDASGRDVFLAKKFSDRRSHRQHSSAALFAHFEGVERRSGEDEGNISIYWFDHGWFWLIPLKDGTVSVGAVCWPAYLKSRDKSVEEFLWDTIQLSPLLHKRMKNAKRILPVTATGNFSYVTDSMVGSDYIRVGDAYAFVDPMFSSGVLFAMNSAERAVELVDVILQQPENHRLIKKQSRKFEKSVKRGIKMFSWFIFRITQPAMRNMFMAPRAVLNLKEGVTSLLAGDVFRGTRIARALIIFKIIYYISYMVDWRNNRVARRKRISGLNQSGIDRAQHQKISGTKEPER